MIRRFSQKNLANFTSLKVGGSAETLLIPESYNDTVEILQSNSGTLWFLGYGSNVLISDHGLPGTTMLWRNGTISEHNNTLIVDAGVWWDDLVKYSISRKLWGLELMSEIPSSVGGAIFGNIAAYGQQVSDTLEWVDIYDSIQKIVSRIPADQFTFSYRSSSFQSQPHIKILRAGFGLSKEPLHTLTYDSALAIAEELNETIDNLESVRRIIVETRTCAGSIYHPDDESAERTAGSFFKNPMVTTEQAQQLASFDESGKTLERIINQSKIHGGSAQRASAAHVLLAAGFKRGQTWGSVKLHDKHVLKIETLPGAHAQDVYDISHLVTQTVKTKLDINLEPEVRFLGEFKR